MSGIFRLTYNLDGKVQRVELDQEQTVLGRSEDCTLTLIAASVSRVHAIITRDAQGWTITDQRSRNGLYVNRQKVQEARLHDNDKISLGLVDMVFTVVEAPDALAVEYSDALTDSEISQSIDIHHFRQRLQKGRPQDSRLSRSDFGEPASRPAGNENAWAIALFSRAAEALISAVSLDDMFKTVVELVFGNLPAERGCVFQYDGSSGQKTLKVMLQKSGNKDGKFRISNTVIQQAIARKSAVLVEDSLRDNQFATQDSVVLDRIRSIMCAPLIHNQEIIGLIYVDTQSLIERFSKQHLEALTTLAVLSAVAVQQASLRESVQREQAIRQRLERYSAPTVVDRIVNSATDLGEEMLAEDRDASVLFLDIVSFTTLSESLTPHEVTLLLNSVFERLTECVFEQEGTLDKFTGDGLMAIFGAPLAQTDHALRAVRAAVRMQQRLVEFNAQHDIRPLRIRIGINSGHVLAGDIGSPRRRDYTVIGDTVNVASRLESQVAQPGQIVVGDSTFAQIKGTIPCDDLGPVSVKGKQHEIRAYRVRWETLRDPLRASVTKAPLR